MANPTYFLRIKSSGTSDHWTDFSGYIKYGGFGWSRADVDAEDSGRGLDGTMLRARVSTKIRLDIECIPLTALQIKTLFDAIYPVYVDVQYYDPKTNDITTKTMYSNNHPAAIAHVDAGGNVLWDGVTFPLIER